MTQPLHGLVAATHTPFHADGSLAPEVVPLQAAHLAKNGIHTVFITGSTGEGHSLTRDERVAIFEAWAGTAKDLSIRVVAHAGSNCLEDARYFAAAASDLGLDSVAALAPSYYKPASLDALVSWCSSIAEAAPQLPFYYYDIPALTGVEFPMDEFLRLASTSIPNLAGIKYTNPDLKGYERCLAVDGGYFDLPWGIDEVLLDAWKAGARGAVGSSYNFAAPLYLEALSEHEAGRDNEAQALLDQAVEIIEALASIGYLGAAKKLMELQGVPVGPARQPIDNPTVEQFDAIRPLLEKLDFAHA